MIRQGKAFKIQESTSFKAGLKKIRRSHRRNLLCEKENVPTVKKIRWSVGLEL